MRRAEPGGAGRRDGPGDGGGAARHRTSVFILVLVARGGARFTRSARLLVAVRARLPPPRWTAAAAAAARRLARPAGRPVVVLLRLLILVVVLRYLSGRLGRRDGQGVGRGQAGRLAFVELMLPLEPGQLIDADVELVGDPGIGPPLAHP